MERNIYHSLEQWKKSDRRKPLILNGARQVGKTHALRRFAERSYTHYLYLNFEQNPKLCSLFENSLDPSDLIPILEIYSKQKVRERETLIIFDEVQDCPRAINSLKYFCENTPELHIAAAGSLLGVRTANTAGFPVGKVNFLHLYPLSFFEFLSALGEQGLREYLEKLNEMTPLPELLHDKLLDILRTYLYVGGMPEAVAHYVEHKDLIEVREIQKEILTAYERDFAKHAPATQLMKISNTWNHIPRQLAKENKKFVFADLRKGARARDYEEAIAWLSNAGLVHVSHRISTPKHPLSAYEESSFFKLFVLDVGMLAAQSQIPASAILEGHQLFTEFKGALTENFVAQELVCSKERPLHYWTSQGSAELDFILEQDGEIYPIEVKAGASSKRKSLLVFGEKYSNCPLSRATLMNLKCDGRISNYPLYLISRLPL